MVEAWNGRSRDGGFEQCINAKAEASLRGFIDSHKRDMNLKKKYQSHVTFQI